MRSMRTWLTRIKHLGLILSLLIVILFVIGGLTYLAGNLGISSRRTTTLPLQVATASPPLAGTPVARYFQVNPAIIDNLYVSQPHYGSAPMDALGPQVPPVGAYLPRSGNTQFSLLQPTPMPTPLPYPTSPPLPLPPLPSEILPTVPALNADGTLRTVPYVPGEADCAPAGQPVDGILTQRFHLYHSGIDIGVSLGTPVIATHSGQITYAAWSDVGYGYLVILQSGAFITYYAHNTSFNVTEGQFIGKGSIIAWSGSTGNSSGPHVHYETRINDVPVDPLTFDSRGYVSC